MDWLKLVILLGGLFIWVITNLRKQAEKKEKMVLPPRPRPKPLDSPERVLETPRKSKAVPPKKQIPSPKPIPVVVLAPIQKSKWEVEPLPKVISVSLQPADEKSDPAKNPWENLLRDRKSLAGAFVLKEILDAPLSKRHRRGR